MSQIAASFLRRCFAPEETVAILLRRQDAAAPMQRVVRLERVLETRYMAWLSYENQHSRNNIYVAANPLRPGSRKRTKESIASVHHLYIDIDTDGDARLAALRASELVPPPTSILATSPGKYQVLWRVEGFNFARQEQTLKLLAIAFGGDPACTDCNRVLRVPGFLNRKYDPAYRVTAEYPDDSIWTPDDFELDTRAVDAMHVAFASTPRKPPLKHSHSESDWAWVLHELSHGKDAVTLTHELASRRADKPNPLLCRVQGYAERGSERPGEMYPQGSSSRHKQWCLLWFTMRTKEKVAMHQYFRRPATFRQFHGGPLGPYIDSYGEWLHQRGYSRRQGRAAIRAVVRFSHWLIEHEITIEEIDTDLLCSYTMEFSRPERYSIRQFMAINLPEVFASKPKLKMDTPRDLFLTEFASHLKSERGLATGTIRYYVRFGAAFLREIFGDRQLSWRSLRMADIANFFGKRVRQHSVVQMSQVLASVRSILRFAHFRGDLLTDYSVSVPRVARWSKAEIPKYFSRGEVEKVLATCDRRTVAGKRDYAILLLLTCYGLRAGEVASLQLGDINWESGEFAIRGKGSRCSTFPLLTDVGEALADYIHNGRPEAKSRAIFLRTVAPLQTIHGQATIASIVRSALRKADIYQRRRTAHAFRHTLATDMRREGASLQEIGCILRHQNPETTTIYAKVDLNSLRELVVAWPGGAR